ncbi:uncharacterized protein [Dysidea avara]|uniref:uncharacterized protein n=1 Tax=Dysidea avara TaxID=196820 RepID=UPI0033258E53
MKYILFGIVVLTVALCEAHLCLLNPHQRGTMNGINTAGANDCILLDGPCGGRKAMNPVVIVQAGEPFYVVFQKNLDHFNSTSPGKFVVSIGANSAEPSFQQVGMIADSNTTSLHLYTLNVTFPKMSTDHAVVQVTYVTNNPKAPPVFYQCADVLLA